MVIAQDEEDLSFMLRKLKEEYTKAGLEINFNITEYLVTLDEKQGDLIIDESTTIKAVKKFKYLGYTLTKNTSTEEEIKNRLGQTRNRIRQLHPIIWDKDITRNTKVKIYNTMVQSIMTYAAEHWIINKRNKSKITAVEMEYWRRCCGVTRMDRVRNEEIRQRMNVQTDALNYIEEKRLQWYGHVRRCSSSRWINRVTDWSPIGRRKRGRPRRSWRDEVDEAMEKRNIGDGEWNNKAEWRLRLREGRR